MEEKQKMGLVERCLGGLAVIGVIGWLLTLLHPFCPQMFPLPAVAGLGEFGDSFGSVNALFSALALLGVLYSIRLQSKELADTRRELTRTAEAQEKMLEASRRQLRISAESALVDTAANGFALLRSTKWADECSSILDEFLGDLRLEVKRIKEESESGH